MLAYKEVLYQRSFKKDRTRMKGFIRVLNGVDDQVFHGCKIQEGEQHQRKMKIGVSIA